MAAGFRSCQLVLLFWAALGGESRYLEGRGEAFADGPALLFNQELKRQLSGEQIYRRALRCLDMLSIEGQFTFTADQPQVHCATFFIGEPEEFISIDFDFVSIDCQAGDFLKVFDGWILKGEKFPSSLDHPLPTFQRYRDFCEAGAIRTTIRSSQNVAMIFFRIQDAGNGFTLTIKKQPNLFPCNVISQTPSGSFTMIVPHQHRNCSFSIIYPAVIKISDLRLGHLNGFHLKNHLSDINSGRRYPSVDFEHSLFLFSTGIWS
ncbi:corticotropin-releasing factor-binding protein isoform X2 [Candoia aspera]|uniref:corticotropin-releasing factor-binding protein isoform X2 n=1 Tax=Candoia aspera TaxID=51853 RepID=UPI002FD85B3A